MESHETKFKELGGLIPIVGDEFVPMDDEEIAALEATLAAPLPASYRAFLQTSGASTFAEYVDFVPVQPLPAVLSSTGEGHLSHFYGAKSSRYKAHLALEWNVRVYRDRMPASMIPVASDGGGNQICLGISGDERDNVYFWDHHHEWDDNDYRDQGQPVPPDVAFQNVYRIAESFDDFILRLKRSDRA